MTGSSEQQTQEIGKIHTKERLKQQNKIFLYLFTGYIPFCVSLHAVHTFLVDVIVDS